MRPWGRFLLVTPCIAVYHHASMRCGVHGRIADGVRTGRAVGDTVGFPRTATDMVRGVPIPVSRAALSRVPAWRCECRGWRLPAGHERSGACVPICCRGRCLGGWMDFRNSRGAMRAARAVWPVWPRGVTWRHGMRVCRSAPPLRPVSRCAWRTDGHAGSACFRGCPRV
jgi:hypothetical protein